MNGFINVLKPPGMTSHDVVSWMRRTISVKKIGHAGTLDPQVAGVLVLAVGRATRLLEYLVNQPKSYRCEILLGVTTDSHDLSGKIIKQNSVDNDYLSKFSSMAARFVGNIYQIPPMVSAIHHDGKRLYELARAGVVVKREPRKVIIFALDVIGIDEYNQTNKILFDVKCSKGTYIRTLCHDIGESLGYGGTMSYLLRTSSGPFKLEKAWCLEEITEAIAENNYDFLLPQEFAIQGMPLVIICSKAVEKVLNGVAVQEEDIIESQGNIRNGQPLCIFSEEHKLIAIGALHYKDHIFYIKPRKVLKNEV